MGMPSSTPNHDRDEFALLIAHYRDDAYRLARRLVRSDAEAEDLTQTAVLNTLRRAEHIQSAGHVKAYLLTTVRNLWRNHLRAQSRRRFVSSDTVEQFPSGDIGPEEQALTALDAALAGIAFRSLSDTSREVIRLRYLEGLGFSELADQLGISPVAARQRAHRAREELVGACIDFAAREGSGACAWVRERFGRYFRGRLTQPTRARVEGHLTRCAECRNGYDDLVDLYGRRFSRLKGEA